MVTDNDIQLLPRNLSKLIGGYDTQLRKKARIGCVGETELICYKRFVNDLQRAEKHEFEYVFDVTEVKRVIAFTKLLYMYDTRGNKTHLKLYPFQLFIISQLFGWKHRKTGLLRFREAYISLARRNGKSALSSVLLHYFMLLSGFRSERAICFSVKRSLAEIVFRQFTAYIQADPDLQVLYKYSDTGGYARSLGTDNYLEVFSGETNSDGFQSGFAVADEVALQNGELYTLISDGQANLAQCLLIGISTAGFMVGGWCHKKYKGIRDGLYKDSLDDTFFTYICEPDEGDDFGDPHVWAKSNPLLFFDINGNYREEKAELYKQKYQKAVQMGGKDLVSFYTKQINFWCAQQDRVLCDMSILNEHAYKRFSFKDVLGLYKKWYLGMDLSQTLDLTSIAFVTWVWIDPFGELLEPYDDDHGFPALYINVISFLPSARLESHISTDHFDYSQYIGKELFLTTGAKGQRISYSEVCDKIEEIKEKYELKYITIAADPYGVAPIQPRLESMCTTFILQSQHRKQLSPYIELFNTMVFDRQIAVSSDSSDIWTRAVQNTVVSTTPDGFVEMKKPSSASSNYRIDPCDAMIDGLIAPILDKEEALTKQEEVNYDDWFNDLYGKGE